MISLCTLGAFAQTGCSGPSPYPPNAVIPAQPSNMPPSAVRVRPGQFPGAESPEHYPQVRSTFPWEPSEPAREWTSIVIHHTAADHGSVESIHEAHLKRKDGNGNHWLGIGYHFVIGNGEGMNDGEIEPTFRWREQMQGAHAGAGEYNEHGVGIALIGNFDEQPPTLAQLSAVKRLVGSLQARFVIPSDKVIGHSDIKATACPGKHFPLEEVRQAAGAEASLNPGTSTNIRLVGGQQSGMVPVQGPGLSTAEGTGLSPVEGLGLSTVEDRK